MPLGGNKVADSSSSSSSSSSSKKNRRRQKKSSASSAPVMTALSDSVTGTIQAVYNISGNDFAGATPGFLPPPPSVAALSEFVKRSRKCPAPST